MWDVNTWFDISKCNVKVVYFISKCVLFATVSVNHIYINDFNWNNHKICCMTLKKCSRSNLLALIESPYMISYRHIIQTLCLSALFKEIYAILIGWPWKNIFKVISQNAQGCQSGIHLNMITDMPKNNKMQ